MNRTGILSPKGWLALTALAIVAGSAVTIGTLFAANNSEQPGSVDSQNQDPELVSAQAPEDLAQINLPPIEKDPPAYPNLDSNLNRVVEDIDAAATHADDGHGRIESGMSEPVLVTFYVDAKHADGLVQYLEDNGVYVRNAGEDYVEAHVHPELLGDASEQAGVLRVDTVVPPRQK